MRERPTRTWFLDQLTDRTDAAVGEVVLVVDAIGRLTVAMCRARCSM